MTARDNQDTDAQADKPLVGISQCLLGARVRYDGDSKPLQPATIDTLNDAFELVPVCPEVEAGLGIPRPPVRLTAGIDTPPDRPRVTGRDEAGLDVTDILYDYSDDRAEQLGELSGFIFKSRSPSCGLNSTPVFINNEQISGNGSGVFAARLCQRYPHLVVAEETEIDDITSLQRFIRRVLTQHRTAG